MPVYMNIDRNNIHTRLGEERREDENTLVCLVSRRPGLRRRSTSRASASPTFTSAKAWKVNSSSCCCIQTDGERAWQLRAWLGTDDV